MPFKIRGTWLTIRSLYRQEELPHWRFQAFLVVSLFDKLIGKSRCPKNKHPYEDRAWAYRKSCDNAKMNFATQKENWLYRNWNEIVAFVIVDRPTRLTGENLGKKQKCSSLLCLWSQVQQDTSGPGFSQTVGGLWTDVHVCEIKPRCQLFLSCRGQRLYKFCFIRVEKEVGAIWTSWNANYLLETFSTTSKMLSTRNASTVMMSSAEYLLLEACIFMTLCICGYRFWKWRSSVYI